MIEWFNDLEANLQSSIVTLIAAVFASFSALLIAFVAYPWQKRKDFQYDLALQKRTVFVEYLEYVSELRLYSLTTFFDRKKLVESYNKIAHQNAMIFVFAEAEVIVASNEYFGEAGNFVELLNKSKTTDISDEDLAEKSRLHVLAARNLEAIFRASLNMQGVKLAPIKQQNKPNLDDKKNDDVHSD